MDWSLLQKKLSGLSVSDVNKEKKEQKSTDFLDKLLKIKNELSERDLAIETKRKEIVSLLSSHDRKTKTSVIETVCTELEDLQSKNDKKSESFKVAVEAVAKKLKTEVDLRKAEEERQRAKQDNNQKKTTESKKEKKSCGLCGCDKKLTKTECCKQWICNDEDQYIFLTYTRNSCYRNHHRYTLCSEHFNENHSGKWQNCKKCEKGIDQITHVWRATNAYNFKPLDKPKPLIKCKNCNFESVELEDFACSVTYLKSKKPLDYYCPKEKCVKASGHVTWKVGMGFQFFYNKLD